MSTSKGPLKAGTKLAEKAGTRALNGPVNITDAKGVTHTFADEAAAFAAWGSRIASLEHRRGAFFETRVKERVSVEAGREKPPEPKSKRA